jgi:hypothetical protein
MKFKIIKRKNSNFYNLKLNEVTVAQLHIISKNIREGTFESHFIVKEYDSEHKTKEEVSFYRECFPSFVTCLLQIKKEIENKTYLEVSEEIIEKTLNER